MQARTYVRAWSWSSSGDSQADTCMCVRACMVTRAHGHGPMAGRPPQLQQLASKMTTTLGGRRETTEEWRIDDRRPRPSKRLIRTDRQRERERALINVTERNGSVRWSALHARAWIIDHFIFSVLAMNGRHTTAPVQILAARKRNYHFQFSTFYDLGVATYISIK